MLVTKHVASRLITLPPATLRFQPENKLKQQKRQPRATRMNTAYDSIARSRLRRHANRIVLLVDHLVQVCEQIRTDQAGPSWTAGLRPWRRWDSPQCWLATTEHRQDRRSPLELTPF
ncbi:hypothetical protein EDB19DRAFT_2032252 [Suillus lakei]|nr:hypothetical protein EDB19DRAFT_2032252 [Suillus lakei]